jgi:hypothetical protein
VQILLGVYMIFRIVKFSAFFCTLVMLIIIALNFIVVRALGNAASEALERAEDRLNALSELLKMIRVIKFYAWEVPFIRNISNFRATEASEIRVYALCSSVSPVRMSVVS